jgi:hypothetical protein
VLVIVAIREGEIWNKSTMKIYFITFPGFPSQQAADSKGFQSSATTSLVSVQFSHIEKITEMQVHIRNNWKENTSKSTVDKLPEYLAHPDLQ